MKKLQSFGFQFFVGNVVSGVVFDHFNSGYLAVGPNH